MSDFIKYDLALKFLDKWLTDNYGPDVRWHDVVFNFGIFFTDVAVISMAGYVMKQCPGKEVNSSVLAFVLTDLKRSNDETYRLNTKNFESYFDLEKAKNYLAE